MTCLRARRVRRRRAERLERRRAWQRLHAAALSRGVGLDLFTDDVRRLTRERPRTWRSRLRWWFVNLVRGR